MLASQSSPLMQVSVPTQLAQPSVVLASPQVSTPLHMVHAWQVLLWSSPLLNHSPSLTMPCLTVLPSFYLPCCTLSHCLIISSSCYLPHCTLSRCLVVSLPRRLAASSSCCLVVLLPHCLVISLPCHLVISLP